jgi:3',5'-cyclic AMP phosphodiesterase CpdA
LVRPAPADLGLVAGILFLLALTVSCGTYGPYRDPITDPAKSRTGERNQQRASTLGYQTPALFSGSPAPGSISFLVLSDIHAYDKESLVQSQATWDRHLIFWGKPQDTNLVHTTAILEAVGKEPLPDFIVLPGDLTVDGELASHRILAGLLTDFQAAHPSVPVLVTTGNHDVNSPQARRHGRLLTLPTLSVSPEGFAQLYAPFGFSQALSRDTESLSYVVEPVPGLALVMLDTASWHKNMFFPIRISNTKGIIRESTLEWMEGILSEARQRDMQIVVVKHHPLATQNPDSSPDPRKPDPMNSARTRELYKQYGVSLVVAGHRHRLILDLDAEVPTIVAPAVASGPQYALLITLSTSTIDARLWEERLGAAP